LAECRPDDFTAIPGVGAVTAQKLHDHELYTYDDLRTRLPRIPQAQLDISTHTLDKIEAWLKEHLSNGGTQCPTATET
jgi:nucleotidyltransferase/DNA polymerase involved in DNA repair